jgi:hypothetical protein
MQQVGSLVRETRRALERGWLAASDSLRSQGEPGYADQTRRFVQSLPPARTEREWLRAEQGACPESSHARSGARGVTNGLIPNGFLVSRNAKADCTQASADWIPGKARASEEAPHPAAEVAGGVVR